jgi:hypothetical protein
MYSSEKYPYCIEILMLRKEPSYLQMFVYPNNRGQRGEDTHQEASARRSRSKQSRPRTRFNSREKRTTTWLGRLGEEGQRFNIGNRNGPRLPRRNATGSVLPPHDDLHGWLASALVSPDVKFIYALLQMVNGPSYR